jgi:hypothetical protein
MVDTPITIEWDAPGGPVVHGLSGPVHADMPWCARCSRAVEGMVVHGMWFEVHCHGMVTFVEVASDGELPTGLVLFGKKEQV